MNHYADVDSSIDQTFIIKRPSGLPVISLSEKGRDWI